jgi:E1A-binding protein p400
LKHTLREYQHIGLDWLVSLYERSLNGILADEMGLGKTIQTIAFMAHLAVDRANWGPHLIVVPTSVMLNWEMEIKKWCPGFKVPVFYCYCRDAPDIRLAGYPAKTVSGASLTIRHNKSIGIFSTGTVFSCIVGDPAPV